MLNNWSLNEAKLRRPRRNSQGNGFRLDVAEELSSQDLLLTEDDELDVKDFLAKTDLWLKLLKRESS